MDSVEEYIQKKGLKYSRTYESSGPHLILSTCPLCKSTGGSSNASRPFYINEQTEQYNTYCCGASGNMFTLKKHFGDTKVKKVEGVNFDKHHSEGISKIRERMREGAALKENEKGALKTQKDVDRWYLDACSDPEVMQYLIEDRKFSHETIEFFKLGLVKKKQKDGNEYKYVAIPSVLNNEVRVLKLRLAMSKIPQEAESFKWVRFKGMQSHIFNEAAIHNDDSRKRVFICEAELDAIACHQMGLTPAVAVTTGAKNFKEEWISLFEDYEEIYMMYDQYDDDPKSGKHDGDDGAEKAAAMLGKFRCKRVVFPKHDVCAWMESSPSKKEIEQVLELAVPYYKADIESVYDASVRVSTTGLTAPVSTGMDFLDKLLGGGILPGEVVIVTADTSVGKTTFTSNLIRAMAQSGIMGLYWPIEGTVNALIMKFWNQILMEDWKTVRSNDNKRFQDMMESLKSLPIYVWGKGYQDHDAVKNLLSVFARRGGKVVVIDHLHKLVMLERNDKDERAKIDSWIAFICEAAKEFGLSIVAIVHPSKPKGKNESDNDESFEPDLHDGKGSSAVYQDPDIYLVLSRTRTKNRDSADETADFVPTKLTLKKMREDRASESSCIVMFHRKSGRYMSVQEAVKIGFKQQQQQENSDKPEKRRYKKNENKEPDSESVVKQISFKRGYTREVDNADLR